jgi:hypothetical protein
MEFNVDKCHYMSTYQTHEAGNYTIDNQMLTKVEETKYLGIIISSDLRWNKHVDDIINKASSRLGTIKRNLGMTSSSTKALAYTIVVRPALEYATSVWNPHLTYQENNIEMIQRRAARFVLNKKYKDPVSEDIRNILKWDSLKIRRLLQQQIMWFKIQNKLVSIKFPAWVEVRDTRHGTGYKHVFIKCMQYRYSFFPRTMMIYNILPKELKIKFPEDSVSLDKRKSDLVIAIRSLETPITMDRI